MGTIRIFRIWWILFIFFIKWQQRWCKVLCLINCNHEKKIFFYFFWWKDLTIPLMLAVTMIWIYFNAGGDSKFSERIGPFFTLQYMIYLCLASKVWMFPCRDIVSLVGLAMEIWYQILRNSHQRCSVKKVLLENSQNSQENTFARVSRSRSATLLTFWYRCFPMNFAKFLGTSSLQNTSVRQLLDSALPRSQPDIVHLYLSGHDTCNFLLLMERFCEMLSRSLREKCPNMEFFLVHIFLYSDWMRRFRPGGILQKRCS